MTRDDLDEVVSLLVAAFYDRPFYRYIAPDSAERYAFLVANFHQRITQGLGVQETDLALLDGKAAGVAVWSPPATLEADAAKHAARDRAMEESLAPYSSGLRERFLAFIKVLTGAQEQTVKQPFWGLTPIAVLPEARGKGIASALIRKKLKEIDELSLPCFLGTQDKINVTIYERFAFQKLREDALSPDITHYTMVRP
ncbi:MAG: GNAT family N-acetyltransferase, partial [Treponema sp.]|nr:GNAT family N-acetyltransferase [Treponema sp.]